MSGMFEGSSASEIIDALQMQPIEDEGAYWALGDRIATMNCIMALVVNSHEGFSAMHRLQLDEGWQWLGGAPLSMLQLNEDSTGREVTLDASHPQVIVPQGVWQGASTTGDWTLISCWCAPAFEVELFELGERDSLIAKYPSFSHRIEELTRVN
jgi:predicted cupin superfamily sugar epimerase